MRAGGAQGGGDLDVDAGVAGLAGEQVGDEHQAVVLGEVGEVADVAGRQGENAAAEPGAVVEQPAERDVQGAGERTIGQDAGGVAARR